MGGKRNIYNRLVLLCACSNMIKKKVVIVISSILKNQIVLFNVVVSLV